MSENSKCRSTGCQIGPSVKVNPVAILRGVADPFQPDGGMRLVQGNLGRAIFYYEGRDNGRFLTVHT